LVKAVCTIHGVRGEESATMVLVAATMLCLALPQKPANALVPEKPSGTLALWDEGIDWINDLLEPYRERIRKNPDRLGTQEEYESHPGYDLCELCNAMYRHGKCASAEIATKGLVHGARSQLANKAVRILERRGLAPNVNASLHETNVKMYNLGCEDDSALWWNACSKLSCMADMEGIDSTCKYRIASMDHNPLGGSEMEAVMHSDTEDNDISQFDDVHGDDDALDSSGGWNPDDLNQATKSKAKAKALKARTTMLNEQGSGDQGSGGAAVYVDPQKHKAMIFQNYYHAHCGAGLDIRMVQMACHFPAKRWCVKLGAMNHVKQCGNVFCNKKPCLWTCTTSEQLVKSGRVYDTATNLVDSMLPRECEQDVDTLFSPSDHSSGWPLPTRVSACADPITGYVLRE
jgi:hypothetical protein